MKNRKNGGHKKIDFIFQILLFCLFSNLERKGIPLQVLKNLYISSEKEASDPVLLKQFNINNLGKINYFIPNKEMAPFKLIDIDDITKGNKSLLFTIPQKRFILYFLVERQMSRGAISDGRTK